MIRRFLPNGIVKMTGQSVAYIEKWMNNYPRQLFNYKSPIQVVTGGELVIKICENIFAKNKKM